MSQIHHGDDPPAQVDDSEDELGCSRNLCDFLHTYDLTNGENIDTECLLTHSETDEMCGFHDSDSLERCCSVLASGKQLHKKS